jgi:hypothetical protein
MEQFQINGTNYMEKARYILQRGFEDGVDVIIVLVIEFLLYVAHDLRRKGMIWYKKWATTYETSYQINNAQWVYNLQNNFQMCIDAVSTSARTKVVHRNK